ncbi:alpha/beta-hydrolase [Atractiella rhizophila]|nr:alpha/beta-hydrolase [Atractiella rhizophila]
MSTYSLKISTPKPFSVSIPQSQVDDLHSKISSVSLETYAASLLSSLPSPSEGLNFDYGLPPTLLYTLVETLKNDYDWRKEEEGMNAMGEHYLIDVEGIEDEGIMTVHFVWLKSEKKDAKTVMVIHGWPGCFLELRDFAKVLQSEYNVLVPSLPGYTFSSGPKANPFSFTYTKAAQLLDATARSIGVDEYYVQGGDWGSLMSRRLAQIYPDRVKAVHLNFINSGDYSANIGKEEFAQLSDVEKRGLERMSDFKEFGGGYSEMQGTTPYTLGLALSLHPLALIAYIGEKFYRWSSPQTAISPSRVLSCILLYHFTSSITSSFWFYYIRKHPASSDVELVRNDPIHQPLALSIGYWEVHYPTRKIVENTNIKNLRRYKVLEKGSHFLAMEEPDLLAREVREFFASLQ